MSKKYKIILILFSLILISLAILAGIRLATKNKAQNISGSGSPALVFMTDQEKAKFQVPATAKAQVIGRDQAGEITVYKIIRSDKDLVLDPTKVAPLSPHQRSAVK